MGYKIIKKTYQGRRSKSDVVYISDRYITFPVKLVNEVGDKDFLTFMIDEETNKLCFRFDEDRTATSYKISKYPSGTRVITQPMPVRAMNITPGEYSIILKEDGVYVINELVSR